MSARVAAFRSARRIAATAAAALRTHRALQALGGVAAAEDELPARAAALQQLCLRLLEIHGLELEVSGRLPRGPVLLASNHVSWLDPLVVASLVPCAPISKLDVAGWPGIGRLVGGLGVLFVRRGDPGSGARVLRGAARALSLGLPVLNFPEGTTTTGENVLPFRPGLFGLARRAGVPVVPIALRCEPAELSWTGDQTFLPHYLRLAGAERCRVTVRFGQELSPAAHPSADGLARAARREVTRWLGGSDVSTVGA
ncbi:lysophospholipid acyltransferase family protein [Anaeromyxobacter paludicola]|uniref:Phospholipid/glycerol acyltransferase domain-containing protein n=1 Tax=Anaeromyxobacter paludicola TaxID=2918171 RepID=A0ABN6N267_9BACT|nr:lysophospholipid acyltransferase family protein [Anaeromyxobacter paludicola]BDG07036.1 hypothetical protein AMPC_01490 [Anaeromyxobacter paludicola]